MTNIIGKGYFPLINVFKDHITSNVTLQENNLLPIDYC